MDGARNVPMGRCRRAIGSGAFGGVCLAALAFVLASPFGLSTTVSAPYSGAPYQVFVPGGTGCGGAVPVSPPAFNPATGVGTEHVLVSSDANGSTCSGGSHTLRADVGLANENLLCTGPHGFAGCDNVSAAWSFDYTLSAASVGGCSPFSVTDQANLFVYVYNPGGTQVFAGNAVLNAIGPVGGLAPAPNHPPGPIPAFFNSVNYPCGGHVSYGWKFSANVGCTWASLPFGTNLHGPYPPWPCGIGLTPGVTYTVTTYVDIAIEVNLNAPTGSGQWVVGGADLAVGSGQTVSSVSLF